MSFEKLGPTHGYVAIATCRPFPGRGVTCVLCLRGGSHLKSSNFEISDRDMGAAFYAFVARATSRVLIPLYCPLGSATSMPTWIWLLPCYYMDIWINCMYDSMLEPNYTRIDIHYGFYLENMYFITNYIRLDLLYEFIQWLCSWLYMHHVKIILFQILVRWLVPLSSYSLSLVLVMFSFIISKLEAFGL